MGCDEKVLYGHSRVIPYFYEYGGVRVLSSQSVYGGQDAARTECSRLQAAPSSPELSSIPPFTGAYPGSGSGPTYDIRRQAMRAGSLLIGMIGSFAPIAIVLRGFDEDGSLKLH